MSSQNILAKNIPLDVGASVINEEKMSTSSYDGPLSSDENGTMTAVYVLGNGEPLLSIIKHLEKLEGKVLTVIDATFIDEKRSKYVKDLIKDAFSNSSNWLYELSIRNFKEEQKNKK